ncbi:MAG: zinc-ribbon domain-containing protein [Clostridia bacterium]|nr:zinc-ribbon domain-containing protein [Clostridia bacterium]
MSPTEIKILIVVILLVVTQGTWIFLDAGKHGENKWLWGLFGLVNVPSSLIIYLIITRVVTKHIICPHCFYSIKDDSQYCSYCGHEITETDRKEGKLEKINQLKKHR